jgi:type II secretory pathway pseudopilin PulG
VIAVNPPPAVSPWTIHERIEWAAIVVLAIVGYAGVMMAVSLMRKIERQTLAAEAAAEAAHNSAQAALLNAQAVIDAERPWVLVSVESSMQVENGFVVTAINRGRSPAQIVSTAELVKIVADESKLPKKTENDHREPATPKVPIILLPGESIGLKTFSRADARGFCESDEQFARIESWEEKIYLIGRVTYRDLVAPSEAQLHQTDWCCWYIHGRQKSGLVIAGPPEYNVHT